MAGQSIVRFVMSGQELRNDDLTLRSYRVSDGSVIHCLITQARVEPVITSMDSNHFDIGFLMFPLFGFILTLLWYARIAYRNYFSGASTCSLVAISFLYLVALVGSFRSGRMNHPHHEWVSSPCVNQWSAVIELGCLFSSDRSIRYITNEVLYCPVEKSYATV